MRAIDAARIATVRDGQVRLLGIAAHRNAAFPGWPGLARAGR
jgi:hypothetical protein